MYTDNYSDVKPGELDDFIRDLDTYLRYHGMVALLSHESCDIGELASALVNWVINEHNEAATGVVYNTYVDLINDWNEARDAA